MLAHNTGTVQVPGSWRELFVDTSLLDFLFQLYASSQPGRATQAMDALVLLASVRRSVFLTDEERDKFLAALMQGMRNVLASQAGLAEAGNHHSFCRLLLRFKVLDARKCLLPASLSCEDAQVQ